MKFVLNAIKECYKNTGWNLDKVFIALFVHDNVLSTRVWWVWRKKNEEERRWTKMNEDEWREFKEKTVTHFYDFFLNVLTVQRVFCSIKIFELKWIYEPAFLKPILRNKDSSFFYLHFLHVCSCALPCLFQLCGYKNQILLPLTDIVCLA